MSINTFKTNLENAIFHGSNGSIVKNMQVAKKFAISQGVSEEAAVKLLDAAFDLPLRCINATAKAYYDMLCEAYAKLQSAA